MLCLRLGFLWGWMGEILGCRDIPLPHGWAGQHFHTSLPIPRDGGSSQPLLMGCPAHRHPIRSFSLAAQSPQMVRNANPCPLLPRERDFYGPNGLPALKIVLGSMTELMIRLTKTNSLTQVTKQCPTSSGSCSYFSSSFRKIL